MSWNRFKQYYLNLNELDFAIDISRIDFGDNFLAEMEPRMQAAYTAMQELEAGAISNPDEGRMVGHYWLRNAALAPQPELTAEIDACVTKIKKIAADVHSGAIKGANGAFKNLLVIGIGGSALGPQFVADALGGPKTDKIKLFFFDNTDPNGLDRTLDALDGQLGETLSVVISKSGGTPETRNGMLEAVAAYTAAGLDFGAHAIAITGEGSKLHEVSKANNWLDFLPMWDWVGGRTSELAAVGLFPAAIQGLDIDRMLAGAKAMDDATRSTETAQNPAALLALMWYFATDGKGAKDMVVLPYKDRLMLFSKYLQQLVMESLGKEKDLDGNVVHQGIAVYGNKGSTDQHAYVQQLREGVHNFFATFIEVLKDREGDSIEVEEGFTSGDFLQGFFLGTRDALYDNGRQSITITITDVTPEAVGQLIALFERAVGLYANLVNINAYHQPGVEAGKAAAATVLEIEQKIVAEIKSSEGSAQTADAIAVKLGLESQSELIFKLLLRLAANNRGVSANAKNPIHETEFFSA
ncbi:MULTISPECIES: glucose-6-phosphate isomerase [unclassified Lentimonas]|uniref:glucose-6-phosphate isomerase n=1 Tax=unclassified Lentimonas TaxID=2630993 RepID=UPI001321045D|nr:MULTISPECIES: glucose-6-phosphate isomerase [unclassified Lentimonas]CAA6676989.1 Glucose-6-phosphate isomerase (EC [Lentimonas sp. CC4]CAA6686795.1 Glucose-6-phosphate isomerase (EC [Lentimonas sp. CC6]CAA7075627.1 Glucose-6-phosphate isomerase (EC [Lentimonas sp. CC4]CAA7168215.1 Glucose-6-phosphate isomerase (EC [Lentimonas sp. CC21]CAA7181634.1 Glucose-6-phosphate isomerase (EC [Lentimonas sp. CC8]